jgi:hypothetical protein
MLFQCPASTIHGSLSSRWHALHADDRGPACRHAAGPDWVWGLAPTQPIPGESTLMRQYGVARETARKAVRALVAEGLVYVAQGRGAYVAARD